MESALGETGHPEKPQKMMCKDKIQSLFFCMRIYLFICWEVIFFSMTQVFQCILTSINLLFYIFLGRKSFIPLLMITYIPAFHSLLKNKSLS